MKRLLSLLPALAAFATALLIAATATLGQTTEHKKPSNAELQYTGKRKAFTLSLIPGVWEKRQQSLGASVEVSFIHRDGDVYAQVVSERTQMSPESLKGIVLANARAVYTGIQVVTDEKRIVNGREVTALIYTGRTRYGSPITTYCYLYAGKEGLFQVTTWAPSNAFDDVRTDLEDFLNGFEVTAKKPTKEPIGEILRQSFVSKTSR